MSGAAIAGLGLTQVGKVYGRSATALAAEAARLAVADAGLALHDVDGLLVTEGTQRQPSVSLAQVLGLRDLRLLAQINVFGASPAVMVATAASAVQRGDASVVVCVFADAPLKPKGSGRDAFGGAPRRPAVGTIGLQQVSGAVTPNVMYALAARRHMETYCTTYEHFGAIAVAQREWAARNPTATHRQPITLDDHQASPMIADPMHLLDICLVSNGGAAVVVTSAERARDLAHRPVAIRGWGQSHPGYPMASDSRFGLVTGAAESGRAALKMAGVTIDDIDLVELYDCYTYTVLVTLEDYGFCPKGEGGPFVADRGIGPGGSLPCNTGGGQLSAFYLTGFTPLSEAIIQVRGDGGDRQVERADIVMVSGNGGVLAHHATLVLGGGS